MSRATIRGENPIVDGTPSGLQAARLAYDGTKSVKFSNQLKLVLIPCREEHHKAGLVPALWWSSTDYLNFQASAHSEIRLLASFEGISYAAARKKLYQNNNPSEEVASSSSSSSSKMTIPVSPRGADALNNKSSSSSSSSSRSPSTSPTTTSSSSFILESSDESSDSTDKCSADEDDDEDDDEEEEEEEDEGEDSLVSHEDDSTCREDPLSQKQNAQHKLHHHQQQQQQQQQHAALSGRANRSNGLVNGLTKSNSLECVSLHRTSSREDLSSEAIPSSTTNTSKSTSASSSSRVGPSTQTPPTPKQQKESAESGNKNMGLLNSRSSIVGLSSLVQAADEANTSTSKHHIVKSSSKDKVVAKVVAAVVEPFPASTSASTHTHTQVPLTANSSEYEATIAAKAAAAADADLLAAADIDLLAECGGSVVDSPVTQARKKRESWLETKPYSNDADSLTFCVALKEPLCASGEKFGEESESRSRRRSNRSLNFQQPPSIAAEVVGWCSVILLVGLVAMDRSSLSGDWAAQLGEFFNHFGN